MLEPIYQLYQFAFAYYLFEKYKYDCIVIDDTEMHKYREVWGNLLDVVFSPEKINDHIEYESSLLLKLRFPRIFTYSSKLCEFFGFISDSNVDVILNKKNLNCNLYLDGYFETVFCKSKYKKLLSPLLKNDLKINVDSDVVVINIRGGEFVRLGLASLKDRGFYSLSIKKVYEQIENPKFHLVTDDIAFSLSVLDGLCALDVIHKPNPLQNFKLIYSSRFKILSDSTFAKWAGYMNEDDSFVIYKSEF